MFRKYYILLFFCLIFNSGYNCAINFNVEQQKKIYLTAFWAGLGYSFLKSVWQYIPYTFVSKSSEKASLPADEGTLVPSSDNKTTLAPLLANEMVLSNKNLAPKEVGLFNQTISSQNPLVPKNQWSKIYDLSFEMSAILLPKVIDMLMLDAIRNLALLVPGFNNVKLIFDIYAFGKNFLSLFDAINTIGGTLPKTFDALIDMDIQYNPFRREEYLKISSGTLTLPFEWATSQTEWASSQIQANLISKKTVDSENLMVGGVLVEMTSFVGMILSNIFLRKSTDTAVLSTTEKIIDKSIKEIAKQFTMKAGKELLSTEEITKGTKAYGAFQTIKDNLDKFVPAS